MTRLHQIRRKFFSHKSHTKSRIDKLGKPIEFKFTFDEWVAVWTDSGHLDEALAGSYVWVMGRNNDIGHYEPGNVSIISRSQNSSDGGSGRVVDDTTKLKMSLAKKGSQPMLGKKHSAATRVKLSISARNRPPVSAEDCAKRSAVRKGKPEHQETCPHCSMQGAMRNMRRWHFDNCKWLRR
jgi:hypothetical protein